MALAFLGDGVYEVLVRQKIVLDKQLSVRRLHSASVEKVRASYQANAVDLILPLLSDEEKDIIRRGRNTNSQVPKSASVSEYRLATGLEALFGYLSLIGDNLRIEELFEVIYAGEKVSD